MTTLRLSTVGAVCAITAVTCFLLGVVAMAASGVQGPHPGDRRPGQGLDP